MGYFASQWLNLSHLLFGRLLCDVTERSWSMLDNHLRNNSREFIWFSATWVWAVQVHVIGTGRAFHSWWTRPRHLVTFIQRRKWNIWTCPSISVRGGGERVANYPNVLRWSSIHEPIFMHKQILSISQTATFLVVWVDSGRQGCTERTTLSMASSRI